MKKIAPVLLIIVLNSCAVQNEFKVTEAPIIPENSAGSYYYVLPQTVLKLKLEMKRELFIPGPYSRFSERFLGITDVSHTQNERYDIGKVQIEYLTEPDPDNYFAVNILKGQFNHSSFFKLSPHGLILDPYGWIPQGAEADSGFKDFDAPHFTDLSVTGFFSEVTDTLYKTIITDTSFVRLPIPRRQREVKTLEQRAQEAAGFILEIRRARFELVAGEIDGFPSGNALEFAVLELNRLEKEYLELFIGKRINDSQYRSFTIIPEGVEETIELLRLDENAGIFPVSSPTGNPVVLDIKPLGKADKLAEVLPSKTDIPLNNFVYRVPDMAQFRILKGERVYYEERSGLFQSGKFVTIPAR